MNHLYIVGIAVVLSLGQVTITQAATDDIVAAYQSVVTIDTVGLFTVPTVVEVPLSATTPTVNNVAVMQISNGTFIPTYVRTSVTRENSSVTAINKEGNRLSALTDGVLNTSSDFSVSFDQPTETKIRLISAEPMLASALQLRLAANVALPTTISITAGEENEVVVAPMQLGSTQISFPVTQSQVWDITLTHSQPLRLSELTLVPEGLTTEVQYGVRFLAQPNEHYQLYFDPDRHVTIRTSEMPNLRSNEGVRLLSVAAAQPNAQYMPADVDSDGIIDMFDNCVAVANPDQEDSNENNRGDACDDFDRDGVLNSVDNCPNNTNRAQSDVDEDGIGDVCDGEESRFTEKYAFVPWVGIGTALLAIMLLFVYVLRRPIEEEEVNQSEEADF